MSIKSDPILGYRSFNLTEKIHKSCYPAISPSQPALSQAGRTVLVTGASGGIGFEISRTFSTAGAAKVILIGSNHERIQEAAEPLKKDGPSTTEFEGKVCDVTDSANIDGLWDSLEADGVRVDVLVLNAMVSGPREKLLKVGWKKGWEEWEANVRSLYQFCERFQKHDKQGGPKKYICNVSTSAIHDWKNTDGAPNYGLNKNAGTLLMQQIAREVAPSDIQIVSFHPGAIFTPGARKLGISKEMLDWDDADLPASFAVWAASPEAEFLHGRFVWAAWDVEELKTGELRKRLDSDDEFLRIGVHGLDVHSL